MKTSEYNRNSKHTCSACSERAARTHSQQATAASIDMEVKCLIGAQQMLWSNWRLKWGWDTRNAETRNRACLNPSVSAKKLFFLQILVIFKYFNLNNRHECVSIHMKYNIYSTVKAYKHISGSYSASKK